MDMWIVWIVAVQFGFVLGLIWVALHYETKRKQQRAEERARFFDRFQEPRELAEFLQSDAGHKLTDALGNAPTPPATVVARTVTVGILLVFLGLALSTLSYLRVLDLRDELLLGGVVCLMGGVGALASAAFTAWLYRRSGRWDAEDAA